MHPAYPCPSRIARHKHGDERLAGVDGVPAEPRAIPTSRERFSQSKMGARGVGRERGRRSRAGSTKRTMRNAEHPEGTRMRNGRARASADPQTEGDLYQTDASHARRLNKLGALPEQARQGTCELRARASGALIAKVSVRHFLAGVGRGRLPHEGSHPPRVEAMVR